MYQLFEFSYISFDFIFNVLSNCINLLYYYLNIYTYISYMYNNQAYISLLIII